MIVEKSNGVKEGERPNVSSYSQRSVQIAGYTTESEEYRVRLECSTRHAFESKKSEVHPIAEFGWTGGLDREATDVVLYRAV